MTGGGTAAALTAGLAGLHFVNELWGELLDAGHHNVRPYRIAAAHADPRVRRHAAGAAYRLGGADRAAPLADPEPGVRAAAAAAIAEHERIQQPAHLPDHHCHGYWDVLQRPLSRALVDQVVASGDVAAPPRTPPCHPSGWTQLAQAARA